ncbi:MAG: protease modulator HflC [Alphaproteobacteria bacterium]|jgi:modulator of FtsH protease HflC|nr:protease modulator HflC [Alphaproteobacteria bacterium]MBT4710882.1 protease modulator HflC [Alphaproteobacteria bacterium]
MNKSTSGITAVVLILVLGVVGFASVFTVQQTEFALVLQLGEPKRVITVPGLHFKIPVIQNVVKIDNRILHLDAAPAEVIASDQKRLVADAYLRYRITDPLLFFQAVTTEAAANLRLQSLLESALRETLGTQPLNAIISGQRLALMEEVAAVTSGQAAGLGLTVIDVRIKRADLPEENSQAVYQRMRTGREQEARQIRAEGAEAALITRAGADREVTVILANADRDSEILRGQGDAKAIELFAEAFGKDLEFFSFYRSMQAYRTALGADDTTMVLSPNSDFFQFFRSMTGVDITAAE